MEPDRASGTARRPEVVESKTGRGRTAPLAPWSSNGRMEDSRSSYTGASSLRGPDRDARSPEASGQRTTKSRGLGLPPWRSIQRRRTAVRAGRAAELATATSIPPGPSPRKYSICPKAVPFSYGISAPHRPTCAYGTPDAVRRRARRRGRGSARPRSQSGLRVNPPNRDTRFASSTHGGTPARGRCRRSLPRLPYCQRAVVRYSPGFLATGIAGLLLVSDW
jgi:hypothetical protein